MARYVDAEKINLPKGFFNTVDNVPKFFEWLDNLPTADVRENVHAHWVIETEMVNGTLCSGQFCSDCGYPQYLTTKFCPNCGAVMVERREDGKTGVDV